jgi:hypothetical protein
MPASMVAIVSHRARIDQGFPYGSPVAGICDNLDNDKDGDAYDGGANGSNP